MWYLVQFIDDKIWHICPQSNIRNISKRKHLAKWPADGRWYPAQIYETAANKSSLIEAKKCKQLGIPKIRKEPKRKSEQITPTEADCLVKETSDSSTSMAIEDIIAPPSDVDQSDIALDQAEKVNPIFSSRSWRRTCNVGLDISSSNENNHEKLLIQGQIQDSLRNSNNSDAKESCLGDKYPSTTTATTNLEPVIGMTDVNCASQKCSDVKPNTTSNSTLETLPDIALDDIAQLPTQPTISRLIDSVSISERIILPDNGKLHTQHYDIFANGSIRQDLLQCELPDNSVLISSESKDTNQNIDLEHCSIPPVTAAERQDLLQSDIPDNSVLISSESKDTNQNIDFEHCSIPPVTAAECQDLLQSELPDNSVLISSESKDTNQNIDFEHCSIPPVTAAERQDLLQSELPDNSVLISSESKDTNQNIDFEHCSIPPVTAAERSITQEKTNLKLPTLTELANVDINLSHEVGECEDLASTGEISAIQGSSQNTIYPRRSARKKILLSYAQTDLGYSDIEPDPFEDDSSSYEISSPSSYKSVSDISMENKDAAIIDDVPHDLGNVNPIEETRTTSLPLNFDVAKDNASSDEENILELPALPVASISSNPDNKRKWDKKFFCIYCKKSLSKLPRHLYINHANEVEVAKILSLSARSSERQLLLEDLRNKGTYIKNRLAIQEGKGVFEPKRRTRNENQKQIVDYLPCPHCTQMYSKKYLFRHVKLCKFKPDKCSSDVKKPNRTLKSTSYLMLPVGPNISKRMKDCILSKMSHDEVFMAVRNDPLILLFAENEFMRLGHDMRYHRTIIDRCRELGRLIISAKKLSPIIKKLSDLLNPSMYKLFRDATLDISGFNPINGTFKAPSLALKIGFTIRKCISALKGEYLEDDILRSEVPKLDAFSEILNSKWKNEVTSHSYRTINEKKWNKPKRIPLTQDIQLLHKYLQRQADSFSEKLADGPDEEAFQRLTEVTLVMVIILNRRRVGEVQYAPLEDYTKANYNPESDTYAGLSEAEKELSKSLIRLVIRGKRGRGVPVLFTKQIKNNIDLLITRRKDCGVDVRNKYLFASLRNSSGHYRAYNVVTKLAKEAGCSSVDSITSTQLRKHVATTVQLLNLKENELDSLAQFMGHDIRVHRQYYRLADETVQLAKISKILLNMEKGNILSMKGKNLDEIDVDDEIEINLDESLDEIELNKDNIHYEETENNANENYHASSNINYCEQNSSGGEIKGSTSITKKVCKKLKKNEPKKQPRKNQDGEKKKTIIIKKPWSKEEGNAVRAKFQNYLAINKLPGKSEIQKFMDQSKNLYADRTWKHLKDYLYNDIKKNNRK